MDVRGPGAQGLGVQVGFRVWGLGFRVAFAGLKFKGTQRAQDAPTKEYTFSYRGLHIVVSGIFLKEGVGISGFKM